MRAANLWLVGTSLGREERHSARLLDETEWNLLNSGLPNYYSHIVSLYEKQKAYAHVTDFARLALQFATGPNEEQQKAREPLDGRRERLPEDVPYGAP